MRIKSIHLHPFAGITDQKFEFDTGLNVLTGPNEAGKTTLYNALFCGLLQTTNLTARQVEQQMGNYFPVTGGDVIRVTVELLDDDDQVTKINKTWKKGNRAGSASLILADGTEMTDEDEVQQRIESMLPVSPATLRTIFLAQQSGLHHTIPELQGEQDVREELGNILRKNLMETGGISVDRFRDLLVERYDEYFKNWDREQQYPNNNRGIQNPYTKGHRGRVLDAFYEMEGLRLDLENANTFEEEMDRLNASLEKLYEQLNNKTAEFEKLNPLKGGIQRRSVLEHQLEAANSKKDKFLDISKRWPVLEYRVENADPDIEKKKGKLEELNEELEKSRNAVKVSELNKRIDKLEELWKKVEDAREFLNKALKIEQTDINMPRDLESDISEFKAQIAAAKLTVRISSESERKLRYSEAGKEEREISIESGDTIDETAEGGFTVISDDLKIQIYSGEGDLENTVQNLAKKETELQQKLEKLKVSSVNEAADKAREYRDAENKLHTAKDNYETELGEDTINELRKQLESFGDVAEVRSQDEISDDIVNVRTELNKLESEIKDAKDQIARWTEQYGTNDKVILELSKVSGESENIGKELKNLPKLPEGFDSPDNFVEHVDALDADIRELERNISDKKIEVAQKQSEAPEFSSEEYESMYKDAQHKFKQINKEAGTFHRMYEKATTVIEKLDESTYQNLDTGFMKWLNLMIHGRFSFIEMERDMPVHFVTSDNKPLSYELLSHGTKDAVSVAWRFALSEYFLGDNTGFLVLDDPLVDLDPDRQKMAAKAIEEYAKNNQVLVFTCHPVHAEMLGGGRVEIAG